MSHSARVAAYLLVGSQRVDIAKMNREGLFAREFSVNCGRSMLKRFQMGGQSLDSEVVSDRLLLTY